MIEQGTLLNFVGGSWQRADARESIAVHNPATGEVLSTAPLSPAAAVARAVEAAQKALPAWRRTPPGDRIQPLFRLKALLDAQFTRGGDASSRRSAARRSARPRASCGAASRTSRWPPASRR